MQRLDLRPDFLADVRANAHIAVGALIHDANLLDCVRCADLSAQARPIDQLNNAMIVSYFIQFDRHSTHNEAHRPCSARSAGLLPGYIADCGAGDGDRTCDLAIMSRSL